MYNDMIYISADWLQTKQILVMVYGRSKIYFVIIAYGIDIVEMSV